MAVLFEKTKYLTDKQFHYCPGCNHGIIHRLVAASSTFSAFSKSDVASCWPLTLKERITPHHPGVLYPVAPFYNSM